MFVTIAVILAWIVMILIGFAFANMLRGDDYY